MENDDSEKSLKIWIYLLPVFLIAAWPAIKWAKKAASGDVPLTKEDYGAFNSEQGELGKPQKRNVPRPELNDGEFRIHYRSAGEEDAPRPVRNSEAEAAEEGEKAVNEAAPPKPAQPAKSGTDTFFTDPSKAAEQRNVGTTKGYLSYVMDKVINNPNAVSAVLNNQYVINGFMSRESVKNATASPEALAKFLSDGSAISNFMNNKTVQAAMNNPAVLNAAAGSGFMQSLLNTPAGQSLMQNPQAMADIIAANPQLQGLMADPKIMSLLMSNPGASAYITQMNTGKK